MNINVNNIRRINDENKTNIGYDGATKQKKFTYFPMSKLIMKKSRRTVLGALDSNSNKVATQKTQPTSLKQPILGAAPQEKPMTEEQMMETDPTTPLLTFKHLLAKESPKMDLVDVNDPQACTEVVKDIQNYLRASENKFRVKASYIENQQEITKTMRKILVDWLIDVHYKFRMKSETLYLTIQLIDRYLAVRSVARHKLQLVGVVALLIAAKYEEIYPPRIRRLLSISADFYKREELLAMERDMLGTLEFNITSVTPYQFLHRFAKAAKATDRILLLTFYFAELSQLSIESLNYSPSLLAAACVYNAVSLELRSWDKTLAYYTQYSEADVLPAARFMLSLAAKETEPSKLNSIRKKWGRSSRHRLSTFIPQDCQTLLKQPRFA